MLKDLTVHLSHYIRCDIFVKYCDKPCLNSKVGYMDVCTCEDGACVSVDVFECGNM